MPKNEFKSHISKYVGFNLLCIECQKKIIEQFDNERKMKEAKLITEKQNEEIVGISELEEIRKLNKQIERQKDLIEKIRQNYDKLLLLKTTEANSFSQERIELKKSIVVSEKTINHLMTEKSSMQSQLKILQGKLDKNSRKLTSVETQTEINNNSPKQIEEYESKLSKKEDE